MARVVGKKPGLGGRGIGTGISHVLPSGVGLSALAVEGRIDDDRDELAWA
jgi:hypothetical protein